MEKNLSDVFNVGTGKGISVNALAKMLLKLTNKKSKIIYGNAIAGELLRNSLDASKLSAKGWKIEYNLEKGLKETYEWFVNR